MGTQKRVSVLLVLCAWRSWRVVFFMFGIMLPFSGRLAGGARGLGATGDRDHSGAGGVGARRHKTRSIRAPER